MEATRTKVTLKLCNSCIDHVGKRDGNTTNFHAKRTVRGNPDPDRYALSAFNSKDAALYSSTFGGDVVIVDGTAPTAGQVRMLRAVGSPTQRNGRTTSVSATRTSDTTGSFTPRSSERTPTSSFPRRFPSSSRAARVVVGPESSLQVGETGLSSIPKHPKPSRRRSERSCRYKGS